MTENGFIEKEAFQLAKTLFGNDSGKSTGFTRRLLDMYTKAEKSNFLLIHNPWSLYIKNERKYQTKINKPGNSNFVVP